MSTHVPYLEPLVNALKKCPELEDVKKCVFVKSQYRGIEKGNQFYPAVWIIPRSFKAKTNGKHKPDCKTYLEHSFWVCAVVNCARHTCDHFDLSIDEGCATILGPFVEGAELLCRLKSCIDDFNCRPPSYESGCFQPLVLDKILEPDECNGHLIHCMEFKTNIIY